MIQARVGRPARHCLARAAGAAVALAAALCLRAAAAPDADDELDRADREHPIVTPARVVIENGRKALRLDAQAVQRAGIRTERVRRMAHAQTLRAYATVEDLQPLVQASAALRQARALNDGAQARLAATRAEFERAQGLYAQEQNVSAGQVQAAQAAFLADQAAQASAAAQLDAQRAQLRLAWGPALATAAQDADAPGWLREILAGERPLVRVILPGDAGVAHAPMRARLLLDGGAAVALHYVGPAPLSQTRWAGRGYFYLGAPGTGLAGGLTLPVDLPTGRNIETALVPASAVVWWQGHAWLFQRERNGDFIRREVASETASDTLGHGLDLPADLEDGTDVVVQGAQVLLSEELRAENFSTDVGGR